MPEVDEQAKVKLVDQTKKHIQIILEKLKANPKLTPLGLHRILKKENALDILEDTTKFLASIQGLTTTDHVVYAELALKGIKADIKADKLPDDIVPMFLDYLMTNKNAGKSGGDIRTAFEDYQPSQLQEMANRLKSKGLVQSEWSGWKVTPVKITAAKQIISDWKANVPPVLDNDGNIIIRKS